MQLAKIMQLAKMLLLWDKIQIADEHTCKEQVQKHLQKQYKEQYPTTQCIIDATEVYI